MVTSGRPQTIAELRAGGHRRETVKQEMRRNLLTRLRAGEPLLPGIVGYEETVLPQLANAIISGHDVIMLGERGQAKSRIMRSLVSLLDEEVPMIAGCEVNDHPFDPICRRCLDMVAKDGDKVEVAWIGRDRRYGEKLATPDISIADLIGEVDPIKVAEGRYLADELTIHYGLLPRTNRGIFGINELPDLAERIQVGLLNIMEEKDVQIRGYRVRLPLDLFVIASANPEDYTSRGRIITPLKDRFGSQVRTHYPLSISEEMQIMESERHAVPEDFELIFPSFMKEIVAELTHLARRSPHISQSSGVSVRMSIANVENLASNAVRRAARLGESLAVPRISDLPFLASSTAGRVEIEALDEGKEEQVLARLERGAISSVFSRHFSASQFEGVVSRFEDGGMLEVGEGIAARAYVRTIGDVPELATALKRLSLPDRPEVRASVIEFVLEGLHLNKRLNKDEVEGRAIYRR
ncbi:MAG: magnesium chelatase [Chloroflexi bacterium]|nr:MAG: magnesium chelatase [Actinobacteria bacterium 13_2_20CM_2_66_6]TMD35673.1 MAG: magnesium chelatase [Chloroflexota bacterium]TMD70791.1 MAG: magnesium chelatase [Chloroflexota bacterium]